MRRTRTWSRQKFWESNTTPALQRTNTYLDRRIGTSPVAFCVTQEGTGIRQERGRTWPPNWLAARGGCHGSRDKTDRPGTYHSSERNVGVPALVCFLWPPFRHRAVHGFSVSPSPSPHAPLHAHLCRTVPSRICQRAANPVDSR